MKAIILAAGKGERLKEITHSVPKPMINYKGKPILEHNIGLCKKIGISDIYINLYHLSEKITEYFGDGNKFGVNIKYSYERELLGTAGAVKHIIDEYLRGDKNFSYPLFVIYGDNYSEYNLNLLINKYKETGGSVIGFHYREDTSQSGVAEFNAKGRIIEFIEKPLPQQSQSHWVNAGIYLLEESVVELISLRVSDFGKGVFPLALKNNIPLYGICDNSEVRAFDTPEMYKRSSEAI